MKTPNFWHKRGIISYLLYPISKIFEAATFLRLNFLNTKEENPIPVICIGNLIAGGSGKTPTCIAIAKIMQHKGFNPVIISRGYKGRLKNILVNKQIHTAKDVGDEPLILSRQCKVIISPNRLNGIKLAASLGFTIAITDDGFQNPYFKKDLSLITIDGKYGFGNKMIIPSGPLRESIKSGLKRADGIILIGTDAYNLKSEITKPVISARIQPLGSELEGKYIAFCGIGYPEKFFDTLSQTKALIIRHYSYPDHHFYSKKEIENLLIQAKDLDAKLITTAKDFVKIPKELKENIKVLEIAIKFDNFEDLEELIDRKCPRI